MDVVQHVNAGFARSLWITLVVLVLVWILKYMGGFATSPDDRGPDWNDTASLFNWHPFLMVLAFPVFMTEALFTYTATPFRDFPRLYKKVIHACFQGVIAVLIVLALVAVFRSHTQKEPKSIDNLYSIHSYLGICTLVAFAIQAVGGVSLFVIPGMSDAHKEQFAVYHHFCGRAAYLIALATMLAGLQEKMVFNSRGGYHIHFKGNYEPLMVIPAVMGPLIILLATSVAFQWTFLRPSVQTEAPPGPSHEAEAPLVTEEKSEEA